MNDTPACPPRVPALSQLPESHATAPSREELAPRLRPSAASGLWTGPGALRRHQKRSPHRLQGALQGGLGTFFWEPTQSGSWGPSLFTLEDGTYRANEADFDEFDALRLELGL